jgi:hypothetical protein
VVTSSQTSTGTCPLVITRTYVITDACGNSASVNHTINIDDNTAPVITGTMTPVTVEGCTTADAPAALTTVAALEALGITITDACTADANLVVTSSQTSTGTCPLVITRTYVITDACGNSASVNHTINIDDNTAPVITGTMTPVTVKVVPLLMHRLHSLLLLHLKLLVLLSLMPVLPDANQWYCIERKLLPALVHLLLQELM